MFGTTTQKLIPTITQFFAFSIKNIKGNIVNFSDFKEKTKLFMIVNVACKCGFTGNHYTQMVQLYTKYHDKGLEIFGFPCNQFKNQESGSQQDIEKFVRDNFNVTFPMFSKIQVNGQSTDPLYTFLRTNSELHDTQTGETKTIPWNFSKFLVDKNGKVIKFDGPKVSPNQLISVIEKELGIQSKL